MRGSTLGPLMRARVGSVRTRSMRAVDLDLVRRMAAEHAEATGQMDIDIERRLMRAVAEDDRLDTPTRTAVALAMVAEELNGGDGSA